MNPQEIPEAGPVFQFLLNASGWLDPIVHVAGLVLMAWAFGRSGKRGYLVVGCYFMLVLLSPLLMPAVKDAFSKRSGPGIPREARAKMDAAIQQAINRVLEEAGHPVMAARMGVSIPVGPILLVGGLWIVARREARRDREQPVAERK